MTMIVDRDAGRRKLRSGAEVVRLLQGMYQPPGYYTLLKDPIEALIGDRADPDGRTGRFLGHLEGWQRSAAQVYDADDCKSLEAANPASVLVVKFVSYKYTVFRFFRRVEGGWIETTKRKKGEEK